jgi:hypothetical protein
MIYRVLSHSSSYYSFSEQNIECFPDNTVTVLAKYWRENLELDVEYQTLKQNYFYEKACNDPKIYTLFWEQEFYSFLEFCNENLLENVSDLLRFDLNLLRKIEGYNRSHIIKIRKVLVNWLKSALANPNKPIKGSNEKLLGETLSLFFDFE